MKPMPRAQSDFILDFHKLHHYFFMVVALERDYEHV